MERCPVCRARFKEEPVCYRCGADLSMLLAIEAEATAWEREAVALLAAGEWIRARRAADQVLALRHSPRAVAARDFAGRELIAQEVRQFERLLQ